MQGMIARVCLAVTLLIPAGVWAWDEEVGASAPVLNGRLPINASIQHVDVTLRGHAVSVRYFGQMAGKRTAAMVLSSYSPPFGWQGVAADYPDLHFPEMAINVNGNRVPAQTFAKAIFEGVDVTRDLQSLGINPLRVALASEGLDDAHTLVGKRVGRYFSEGAAGKGLAYPLWQLLYGRSWQVHSLGPGPFVIQLDYRARPAKREVNTESKSFSASVLAHCADPEQVKAIIKGGNRGAMPETVIVETITMPLLLANMPPMPTVLTIGPDAQTRPGLRLAAALACGPEESALLGQPFFASSRTATSATLSVLEIFIQS